MAGSASGWADQHGREGHPRVLAPGLARPGVTISDMPAERPRPRRPHVRGLAGPTRDGPDEDHQPGGGLWYEVTW